MISDFTVYLKDTNKSTTCYDNSKHTQQIDGCSIIHHSHFKMTLLEMNGCG